MADEMAAKKKCAVTKVDASSLEAQGQGLDESSIDRVVHNAVAFLDQELGTKRPKEPSEV